MNEYMNEWILRTSDSWMTGVEPLNEWMNKWMNK